MERRHSWSERREEIGDKCKFKVLLVSKLMLVILVLGMLGQENSLKYKKSLSELHGEFQGNLKYRVKPCLRKQARCCLTSKRR